MGLVTRMDEVLRKEDELKVLKDWPPPSFLKGGSFNSRSLGVFSTLRQGLRRQDAAGCQGYQGQAIQMDHGH